MIKNRTDGKHFGWFNIAGWFYDSVCIYTYNWAKILRRTLVSRAGQNASTLRNLERPQPKVASTCARVRVFFLAKSKILLAVSKARVTGGRHFRDHFGGGVAMHPSG